MTIRQALQDAIAKLTTAKVPSASTAAEVLLMHVLGQDRAYLHAHPEGELTPQQAAAFNGFVEKRAVGTPTQYLTGKQEFWGMTLEVEPGVFIPRPETETVVEVALKLVRERLQRDDARLVDVGTGTGCIALALAKELPGAEVVAIDVSDAALALAKRNAEKHGLAERVKFLKSELLEGIFSHHGTVFGFDVRTFDLIVSNPPYIAPEDAGALPKEVREHEPAEALYSEEEGLETTEQLIQQARFSLTKNGWLVVELGHGTADAVKELFDEHWGNLEITNDLAGIPRVLAAQKI
jgi:release factor glutamine methyltransferase